jgi:hypothetical protein
MEDRMTPEEIKKLRDEAVEKLLEEVPEDVVVSLPWWAEDILEVCNDSDLSDAQKLEQIREFCRMKDDG